MHLEVAARSYPRKYGVCAGGTPIVAKLLRDFYDHRSAIVHGSRKRKSWSEISQQRLDRMLLVSALSLAALSEQCPNAESLRGFFNELKWSTSVKISSSPVSAATLRRAYS